MSLDTRPSGAARAHSSVSAARHAGRRSLGAADGIDADPARSRSGAGLGDLPHARPSAWAHGGATRPAAVTPPDRTEARFEAIAEASPRRKPRPVTQPAASAGLSVAHGAAGQGSGDDSPSP